MSDSGCDLGRGLGRALVDAEQELGIDEHPLDRRLDATLEAPRGAALVVERHQRRDVLVGHRPPEGPAGQRRRDPPGARGLLRGLRRTAGEDALAAGRLARAQRDCTARRSSRSRRPGPSGFDVVSVISVTVAPYSRSGGCSTPSCSHDLPTNDDGDGVRPGLRVDRQIQVRVGRRAVVVPLLRREPRAAGGHEGAGEADRRRLALCPRRRS